MPVSPLIGDHNDEALEAVPFAEKTDERSFRLEEVCRGNCSV